MLVMDVAELLLGLANDHAVGANKPQPTEQQYQLACPIDRVEDIKPYVARKLASPKVGISLLTSGQIPL
ncbi:hypothetical protein Thiowin_01119 [Thiorhodovibrio winogradskyi]|uniref:Uncharacterized protein n=1 Tax=Thiorhodovibrio winogradskyi TaxID=77007 RepID=A0ABZ0S7P5_9GAMM